MSLFRRNSCSFYCRGRDKRLKKITIREPIWKYKAIGIREDKVTDDFQIKISYKTKDGQLLYPGTFFMTKEDIKSFPIKYLGGMYVYLIPIEKLREKDRQVEKEKER